MGEGWERTRDGFVVEEEEHTVKDEQEVAGRRGGHSPERELAGCVRGVRSAESGLRGVERRPGPAALRTGYAKEELPLQGGGNLQKPFKQASDTIAFGVRIFSCPLPPVSKTSQGPAPLFSLEGIQGLVRARVQPVEDRGLLGAQGDRTRPQPCQPFTL